MVAHQDRKSYKMVVATGFRAEGVSYVATSSGRKSELLMQCRGYGSFWGPP